MELMIVYIFTMMDPLIPSLDKLVLEEQLVELKCASIEEQGI